MNKLKINKDMKFDFYHLMEDIDTNHEFTLRDVLCACMDSCIPIDILSQILRCSYIKDYYEEMSKGTKSSDSDIIYLELSHQIGLDSDNNTVDLGWIFDGVGEKGLIPKDILDNYSKEDIQKFRDEGYTQRYALEFSPVYELADYSIKIRDEIQISDWDKFENNSIIKGKPNVKLIDALYGILWELSFLGSPKERDEKKEDLDQRVKRLEDGTEELLDFEEVKVRLKEKYNIDLDK